MHRDEERILLGPSHDELLDPARVRLPDDQRQRLRLPEQGAVGLRHARDAQDACRLAARGLHLGQHRNGRQCVRLDDDRLHCRESRGTRTAPLPSHRVPVCAHVVRLIVEGGQHQRPDHLHPQLRKPPRPRSLHRFHRARHRSLQGQQGHRGMDPRQRVRVFRPVGSQ